MLNVHAILPRSRANGPGVRTVIWLQGCTLCCPGCFNPGTHSAEPRLLMPEADLLARIIADQHEIEGVSISGGEPLQQPEGLLAMIEHLAASRTTPPHRPHVDMGRRPDRYRQVLRRPTTNVVTTTSASRIP